MTSLTVKFLAIFGGILSSLLVTEIMLRIFFPQMTLDRAQAFTFNCFEEGTHRWIRLQKNKTCILKSTASEFRSVVKTNSLGLRNPEIPMKKPDDTTRVLFVGDSFTMGWAVDENQAYPRLTEKYLQNDGKKVQAINAGFSASGPSGYYIYLQQEGMKLDPDIVVIGFFLGNDITSRNDVAWLSQDQYGLPDVIRSKTSYIDYTGQIRSRTLPLKYQVPFLRNSHLFLFLMDRLFPQKPEPVTDPVITPLVCLFKPSCTTMDRQKEEVEQLFLGMKRIVEQENHKKLIVAIIPVEFQVNPKTRPKYGINIPLTPHDRGYPDDFFGSFFQENGISFIDLLPDFQKHADVETYYKYDDHWNSAGHTLAAKAIAQSLKDYLDDTSEQIEQTPASISAKTSMLQ